MTVDELMERSDAVYMAIGTQKPMRMDVPGEDLQGVESGLTFLRRVGLHMDYTVPRHLVVIGGGSTAMDVARTALRLGAEDVTVAYRRTMDEMPAGAEEVEEALEEGIRILELAAPVEILGENGAVTGIRLIRRELAGFGKDGRMNSRSIPGSEFDIPCDGVIAAVNQGLDADTLPNRERQGLLRRPLHRRDRAARHVRRRRRRGPRQPRGHQRHRRRQDRRRRHRPLPGRQRHSQQGRGGRHSRHPRGRRGSP